MTHLFHLNRTIKNINVIIVPKRATPKGLNTNTCSRFFLVSEPIAKQDLNKTQTRGGLDG